MIRKAKIEDAPAIRILLEQLGYPTIEGFVEERLPKMLSHPDQTLVVYEHEGSVVGFVSLHLVPQVALTGSFAIISYLAVHADYRNHHIGSKLEKYCVDFAAAQGCDRMQVHCHSRRADAHRFYERRGYAESRKYYTKSLQAEE
jgi:N-acetylglutamate synthase-like GNAT family acetyltransferase